MAYNHRYSNAEISDIHGKSTNPYIDTKGGNNSRSNSPIRSGVGTKQAETLNSDNVYANELKIRNHIKFLNKEGVIGPFVGIKDSGPVPKSPQIPIINNYILNSLNKNYISI